MEKYIEKLTEEQKSRFSKVIQDKAFATSIQQVCSYIESYDPQDDGRACHLFFNKLLDVVLSKNLKTELLNALTLEAKPYAVDENGDIQPLNPLLVAWNMMGSLVLNNRVNFSEDSSLSEFSRKLSQELSLLAAEGYYQGFDQGRSRADYLYSLYKALTLV